MQLKSPCLLYLDAKCTIKLNALLILYAHIWEIFRQVIKIHIKSDSTFQLLLVEACPGFLFFSQICVFVCMAIKIQTKTYSRDRFLPFKRCWQNSLFIQTSIGFPAYKSHLKQCAFFSLSSTFFNMKLASSLYEYFFRVWGDITQHPSAKARVYAINELFE